MIRRIPHGRAFVLAAPLHAQPADDAAKLAEFKTFAEKYRTERSVLSFSYAIVKDGRIVAAEGIGWQDHDAEERTTPETSYLVASMTKTFTGATLLAMDADGVIDLDDDFTTLSDWKERCEWLATSGNMFGGGKALDDGYVPPKIDCTARITVRQVLQMRMLGKPGSNFLYNPIVFGRLANWVEEKTGKPFDQWVRRYVIDKAGLKDIAAGWRDAKGAMALVNLAPPFRYAKDGAGRFEPSPLPNPEMNASSGIIASARSLAEYSLALDQGRILPRPLLERMWTPPTRSRRHAGELCLWLVDPAMARAATGLAFGPWPNAYAGRVAQGAGQRADAGRAWQYRRPQLAQPGAGGGGGEEPAGAQVPRVVRGGLNGGDLAR